MGGNECIAVMLMMEQERKLSTMCAAQIGVRTGQPVTGGGADHQLPAAAGSQHATLFIPEVRKCAYR